MILSLAAAAVLFVVELLDWLQHIVYVCVPRHLLWMDEQLVAVVVVLSTLTLTKKKVSKSMLDIDDVGVLLLKLLQ